MQKTVNSIQELYRRWQDLLNNPSTAGKDEFTWTTNEIKNNIRSVEWDLEDLEETIGIVEANPSKFTLSANEISSRKGFIGNVRKTAQSIKDDISSLETKAKVEKSNRQVSCLYSLLNFRSILTSTVPSSHSIFHSFFFSVSSLSALETLSSSNNTIFIQVTRFSLIKLLSARDLLQQK